MTPLLFMREDRQFHNFIMITMIVSYTHDTAIRWEGFQEPAGSRRVIGMAHGRPSCRTRNRRVTIHGRIAGGPDCRIRLNC